MAAKRRKGGRKEGRKEKKSKKKKKKKRKEKEIKNFNFQLPLMIPLPAFSLKSLEAAASLWDLFCCFPGLFLNSDDNVATSWKEPAQF